MIRGIIGTHRHEDRQQQDAREGRRNDQSADAFARQKPGLGAALLALWCVLVPGASVEKSNNAFSLLGKFTSGDLKKPEGHHFNLNETLPFTLRYPYIRSLS